RRPYAGRLVPVRQPRGTPADRCATYLPQGRPTGRGPEVVEDHVLLRRSEVSRARCCEVRPSCCARFDREKGRRSRGSVPGGFTEDGRRPRVALVWDAGDVPQGRLPHRRPPRDEWCSHEENDCTSTGKETLIADLQYSASRAGRSAGRSLSWHGRGRGFKSHPVHFQARIGGDGTLYGPISTASATTYPVATTTTQLTNEIKKTIESIHLHPREPNEDVLERILEDLRELNEQ